MNIDALRIFCSVVEEGSFSDGAAANRVSQSAATQCVRRIEQHFGLELLDRRTRPFALTPEGRVCYEGFRRVLKLLDELHTKLQSVSADVCGTVRVAAIYSVGLYGLREAMRQFMRNYPAAKVQLEYLRPDDIYTAVTAGRTDLGIVSFPSATADLAVVPLAPERMVLVCPPGHRLADEAAVAVKELHGVEFVAFDRGLPIRREIDRFLKHQGVSVRTMLELDNIETIKHAVEVGVGVSILPEPTVGHELQLGTLAAVDLAGCGLRRPIGVIYRQRQVLTPTHAKFIATLESPRVDAVAEAG